MRKFVAFYVWAIMGLLLPMGVCAQDQTSVPQAKMFIESLGNEAIAMLSNKAIKSADRVTQFGALLDKNFDIPKISKFVLGPNWRQATPEQQERFTALMRQYIINLYKNRLENYNDQQLKVGEPALDSTGKYILVPSTVVDSASGSKVNIDWRVPATGQPKVVDVSVEGISMGLAQRSEFNAIIQKNGGRIESLLAEMAKPRAQNKL
jgi:phospholipid transport system substrate-binding protein